MKLRIITKRQSRSYLPKVSFSKSGYMSINKSAQELMGIVLGDHIMIVQDEDRPKDFYLIKTEDTSFPKLRNTGNTSLMVGYVDAQLAILEAFGLPKTGLALKVGGQIKTPLGTAVCLITKQLEKKEVSRG